MTNNQFRPAVEELETRETPSSWGSYFSCVAHSTAMGAGAGMVVGVVASPVAGPGAPAMIVGGMSFGAAFGGGVGAVQCWGR